MNENWKTAANESVELIRGILLLSFHFHRKKSLMWLTVPTDHQLMHISNEFAFHFLSGAHSSLTRTLHTRTHASQQRLHIISNIELTRRNYEVTNFVCFEAADVVFCCIGIDHHWLIITFSFKITMNGCMELLECRRWTFCTVTIASSYSNCSMSIEYEVNTRRQLYHISNNVIFNMIPTITAVAGARPISNWWTMDIHPLMWRWVAKCVHCREM